jgi:hypothetical protein
MGMPLGPLRNDRLWSRLWASALTYNGSPPKEPEGATTCLPAGANRGRLAEAPCDRLFSGPEDWLDKASCRRGRSTPGSERLFNPEERAMFGHGHAWASEGRTYEPNESRSRS